MHNTIIKFGYPITLIKEYKNWVVLLRPKQVTIGSLIIICKENAISLPTVSENAFFEFHSVLQDVERLLKDQFNPDKINYLALMMVDNHVHFHVIPRYADSIKVNNVFYDDKHWPNPPVLTDCIDIKEGQFRLLLNQCINIV